MKYYKITPNFYNTDKKHVASSATLLDEGSSFENFDLIRCGNRIINLPIYNFFLESADIKENWELEKFDIHKLIRQAGLTQGWLISDKLKTLLENFKISEPYNFYEARLIFKGEKYKYWIYQQSGTAVYNDLLECININKTIFYHPLEKQNVVFNSFAEYHAEMENVLKKTKYSHKYMYPFIKKLVLKSALDFYPAQTFFGDSIISENLKNAMEENGITGFEFGDLDYEVVVDKQD